MKIHRSILATVVLAFAASSALAITVPVSEDTSTNASGGKLTPAAGKAPLLNLGNPPEALLRFDLSTLPADVTAATVVSATLHFYVVKAKVPDDIGITNVTSDWHETDNGPTPSIDQNSFATIPSAQVATKKFASVDVTAQIVAILNGGSNFGFALFTGAGKKITIASKEGPATGYPAYLDIETNAESTGGGGGSFGDGLVLDNNDGNDGSFSDITFGAFSGEGIGSQRNDVGNNKDGLDFYTNSAKRLSISNDGDIAIAHGLVVAGNTTLAGATILSGTTTLAGPVSSVGGINLPVGTLSLGPNGADATVTITQNKTLTVGTSNTYGLEVNNLSPLFSTIAIGTDASGGHIQTFPSILTNPPLASILPLFINDAGGNTLIDAKGGGSVGIGTSSPEDLLHLSKATNNRMLVSTPDNGFAGYRMRNSVHEYFAGISGSTATWVLNDTTNSTNRLTVDTGGQLAIGPFLPGATLDVQHQTNAAATFDSALLVSKTSNGSVTGGNVLQMRTFTAGGTMNLELFEGNAFKPGGGSWSVVSDRRLKKDIEPLTGALDHLLQLRSVTYQYIDPVKTHQLPGTQTGFIAQEVEKVFPEWVGQNGEGYKYLNIRGFESQTVEALRELRKEKDAQIAKLQAANAALAERLTALEKAIQPVAQKDAGSRAAARKVSLRK